MAITQDEMQSIVNAVLSSIRTNSRTIDQLTPVTTLGDTDYFEINGGKRVSYEQLCSFLAEEFSLSLNSVREMVIEKWLAAKGLADTAQEMATRAQSAAESAQATAGEALEAAEEVQADLMEIHDGKNLPDGFVTLDGNGLIPTRFIPGAMDDVKEFGGMNAPATAAVVQSTAKLSTDAGCSVVYDPIRKAFLLYEQNPDGVYYQNWGDRALFGSTDGTFCTPYADKVYVDTETNKTYRWGGSSLVPIGSDLALGYTSGTAFPGDEGQEVKEAVAGMGAWMDEVDERLDSLATEVAEAGDYSAEIEDLGLRIDGGERKFVKDETVTGSGANASVGSVLDRLPRGSELFLRADKECRLSMRIDGSKWVNSAWGTDVSFVIPEGSIDIFRLEVRQAPLDVTYSIYENVKGTDEKIADAAGPLNARTTVLEGDAFPVSRLYLGKMVQGELYNAPGSGQSLQIVASDKNVSMEGLLVLPWRGLTVTVKMPSYLKTSLCGLDKNPSFGSSLERWAKVVGGNNQRIITGGCRAQWPERAVFYRIYFWRSDNGDLTAEEVQGLIDSGEIEFTYDSRGEDICVLNAHKDASMLAARTGSSNVMDCFTFIHLSDIHGDVLRLERAFEYARAKKISYILCTGDYCVDTLDDGIDFVHRIASQYPDVRFIPSIGNHDMAATRTPFAAVSESEAFAKVIGPFAEDGAVTAEHTYYYTDVATMATPTAANASAKVRIICLNEYEGADWSKKHISQAQLEFFINALKTTPAGYGVIVMMHGMEFGASTTGEPLTKCETAENFYQQQRRNSIAGIPGRPFSRIVEAWQKKGAVSFTFTNADDGTEIEVSGDFAGVASNEFICFLSGHEHYDVVGYNPTEEKRQVTLNVCCAAGISDVSGGNDTLSASGDLPRARGVTQDAFNVCGVDRSRGEIRIVRIGADVTGIGMTRRDVAVIAYK